MRLLCITTLFPFPEDNGGSVRIAGQLRALAASHDVHLMTMRASGTTEENVRKLRSLTGAREVENFPPPLSAPTSKRAAASLWARSLLRGIPPWVLACLEPTLVERIRTIASDFDAAVVLDDYAGVYVGALTGGENRGPIIADKHNVLQASTAAAKPVGGPWRRRLEHALALRMTRSFERRYLAGVDAVVVTTDEEAARLERLYGRHADAVIPTGVEVSAARRNGRPRVVGWVGSLDWRANAEGLVTFVENAWPPLGSEGFELLVAGRKPPPSVKALERFPGVKVLGYLEQLGSFLDEVAMAVVPLWEGPGIKVKTLTFLGAGLPIAATPVGLEGVPAVHGRHCMVADTPEGLARGLRQIATDRELAARLAKEGRQLIEDGYRLERVGVEFVKAVERAAATGGTAMR